VAAGQALEIGLPDADYWLLSAWNPALPFHAGLHAGEILRDLRRKAQSALQRGVDAHPQFKPMLIKGRDVPALLSGIANLQADLVSVGSHGTSRAAGVLFGSVASAMAHHAPCSVLIARETAARFPGLILHPSDGSPESNDAAQIAGELAARHGSTIVTLHVSESGGEGVAEEAVTIIERSGRAPVIRVERGSPHRRIIEIANEVEAGLVVMGSRGQTGLAALGSVSERVSHRAPCSVLIVRRPIHPAIDQDAESE
jgi:nucleotide-binding universal stress UspA family protein